MMRRMKIKASPNLFGGSKKANILGKKPQLATKEVVDLEGIGASENKQNLILNTNSVNVSDCSPSHSPPEQTNEKELDSGAYENKVNLIINADHVNVSDCSPSHSPPEQTNEKELDSGAYENKVNLIINADHVNVLHCKPTEPLSTEQTEGKDDVELKPNKIKLETSHALELLKSEVVEQTLNNVAKSNEIENIPALQTSDIIKCTSENGVNIDTVNVKNNIPMHNTTSNELTAVTDLESSIQKSPLSSKNIEESCGSTEFESKLKNNISGSDMFKNRVTVKPPVNLNFMNKITGRRTRIKGRPVVPITKRPMATTLVPSDIKHSVNDISKSAVLENKINNEPVAPIVQDIKNHKESNLSTTSPQLDTRKRVESKENIDKMKLKESDIHNRRPVKLSLDAAIKSEELTKEKKIFHERKQNYRKKMSTGNLERSKMTMFDLIFWNPATNPMPGRLENERVRSRNNSINEADTTSEVAEEQKAEEEGLQTNIEKENVNVDTKTSDLMELDSHLKDSSGGGGGDDDGGVDGGGGVGGDDDGDDGGDGDGGGDDDYEEEEATSTLAPQVKIGPNGELIVDEKSLVIQTTAAKNRDEILKRTEVVEESNDSSHYGKWSKKRKRSTEWTRKETARFYKALSTVGTDFSLMETIFKWRSRSELKIKFKKEERINRHLIDTALNDCTQFDFSIFDESDYDPEEDRKETKEAEKAEAKKKKEIEREQKKLQKKEEKKIKKEQEKIDKLRKKKLRSIYKKRKRKRSTDTPKERKRNKSTTVIIEPQEVICEVVFSTADKNTPVERNCTQTEGETNAPKELPTEISSTGLHTASNSLCSSPNYLVPNKIFEVSNEVASVSAVTPEVLGVDSKERIERSSGGVSVSCSSFMVRDSTRVPSPPFHAISHSEDIIQPGIEVSADPLSQVLTVPSAVKPEAHGNPISISTIPVSIDAELYSSMYEGVERTVADVTNAKQCNDSSGTNLVETGDPLPLVKQKEAIVNADMQFCCPITSVQKSEDGNQFIEISTTKGIKRINVPPFGPQTSSIIIMATADPQNPLEKIYHVYTVAPLNDDTGTNTTEPNDGLVDNTKDS